MSKVEIREPKQQRSIEKKNKIVQAGYKLFCEKGYHNTNTAEIAKEAGVSTGILYNYFKDKKDIFIHVLNMFFEQISYPMFVELKNVELPSDLRIFLNKYIDIFIERHTISKNAHEEMMSMIHSDEDVNTLYKEFEENLIESIAQILQDYGLKIEHPYEKVHIVFNLIEDLCHETVYHKHSNIDNSILKSQVIDLIVNLLQ